MSSSPLPPQAAVFVDLENITGFHQERITRLLIGLREILADHGVTITLLCAYARRWKGFSPAIVQRTTALLTGRGCVMRWTQGIADTALIDEAQQRIDGNAMPSLVVIVSDDGDFIPLIEKLREKARTTGVVGRDKSMRLARAADFFIPLSQVAA